MREILFRGKAINRHHKRGEYRTKYENGDWVYGLLEKHYNERFKFPAEMRNTDGVSGIQVDYKTIGQFTGCRDKNGTKIFEGDIVKAVGTTLTAVVQYFPEEGAFMLYCKERHFDDYLGTIEMSKIEIIGNIYDNSELLDNPKLLKGDDKTE